MAAARSRWEGECRRGRRTARGIPVVDVLERAVLVVLVVVADDLPKEGLELGVIVRLHRVAPQPGVGVLDTRAHALPEGRAISIRERRVVLLGEVLGAAIPRLVCLDLLNLHIAGKR